MILGGVLAWVALVIAIGCTVGLYAWMRAMSAREMARIEVYSNRLLGDTKRASGVMLEDARLKAEAFSVAARAEHERQTQQERLELQAIERRLLAREETLDLRITTVEGRSAELTRQEQGFLARREQLAAEETRVSLLTSQARDTLERAAGLTRDEAKRHLVEEVEAEARHEAGRRIRQVEGQAREEADRKAKRIITIAIERLAGEFIAERTVSVVHLPSDDRKGRIIGREGRNIRAIEAATGVDLIVDDTPEAVIVSCHSPIRREIARIALERLIADGRIHPSRIVCRTGWPRDSYIG